MFIVTLGWTFNPGYPILNLQVIGAIGMSMLVLSVLVYMDVRLILLTGLLLVVGHNLLDGVHIPGTGVASVIWAILHDGAAAVAVVLLLFPCCRWFDR